MHGLHTIVIDENVNAIEHRTYIYVYLFIYMHNYIMHVPVAVSAQDSYLELKPILTKS